MIVAALLAVVSSRDSLAQDPPSAAPREVDPPASAPFEARLGDRAAVLPVARRCTLPQGFVGATERFLVEYQASVRVPGLPTAPAYSRANLPAAEATTLPGRIIVDEQILNGGRDNVLVAAGQAGGVVDQILTNARGYYTGTFCDAADWVRLADQIEALLAGLTSRQQVVGDAWDALRQRSRALQATIGALPRRAAATLLHYTELTTTLLEGAGIGLPGRVALGVMQHVTTGGPSPWRAPARTSAQMFAEGLRGFIDEGGALLAGLPAFIEFYPIMVEVDEMIGPIEALVGTYGNLADIGSSMAAIARGHVPVPIPN
ncbi:MAG: hypothetical protein KIT43_01840 [Bauldia sp.]|nr:hypothetical protein [Bauldia sp.]MCW5718271.1 hypothetical protein [Bauldia sp.]